MRLGQRFYLVEVFSGVRPHRPPLLPEHGTASRPRPGGREARGAVTIQYPEERRPYSPRLRSLHRLVRARGRLTSVRGVHDVRDGVPRALHLYRGRRAPQSRDREDAATLRHRSRQVRLLRLLRGGVPRGCHPHGHRHPRVLVVQPRRDDLHEGHAPGPGAGHGRRPPALPRFRFRPTGRPDGPARLRAPRRPGRGIGPRAHREAQPDSRGAPPRGEPREHRGPLSHAGRNSSPSPRSSSTRGPSWCSSSSPSWC